jgi:X-linked retinitis pigmentosa GTPase regulator
MTSQVDPKKLKSLLKSSQTELEDPPEAEAEDGEAPGEAEDEGDDEGEDGDGEEAEHTVESMTAALQPAVATLNEIVDEFRTGTDAQPKAGVERLEEDLDAKVAHELCEWATEVGKKDFRALGDALDLEDVDGFVGWMRAVRKMEDDGEGETSGEEESEDEGEGEGEQDDGEGGGEEEDEEAEGE